VIDNSSDTARVQVALVGAGYWGSRLARNLGAAPSCSVRWVCDLQRASACEVGGPIGAAATTSLMDVLADPAVEAVVVATPASTHRDVVAACLETDRHVLVEKPLAHTANDAQGLGELARARGLVVMCDHTYRFAPAVQVVRDLIAAGMLGRLRSVDSVRANPNNGQPPRPRTDVDVFWDLGHHDLSILSFVLDAAARPVAASARSADLCGMGWAHVGELTLDLADGAIVRVHVDWCAPKRVRTMTFTGDDGWVTWNDGGFPSRPRLELHRRGATRVIPVDDHREPLGLVVDEFLAAVTERRAPLCGPEAELAVLAMLEAASRSAAAGGARASVDIVSEEKR
jgi:predicted dehydrogenase